jgi:hypothetical protein
MGPGGEAEIRAALAGAGVREGVQLPGKRTQEKCMLPCTACISRELPGILELSVCTPSQLCKVSDQHSSSSMFPGMPPGGMPPGMPGMPGGGAFDFSALQQALNVSIVFPELGVG